MVPQLGISGVSIHEARRKGLGAFQRFQAGFRLYVLKVRILTSANGTSANACISHPSISVETTRGTLEFADFLYALIAVATRCQPICLFCMVALDLGCGGRSCSLNGSESSYDAVCPGDTDVP